MQHRVLVGLVTAWAALVVGQTDSGHAVQRPQAPVPAPVLLRRRASAPEMADLPSQPSKGELKISWGDDDDFAGHPQVLPKKQTPHAMNTHTDQGATMQSPKLGSFGSSLSKSDSFGSFKGAEHHPPSLSGSGRAGSGTPSSGSSFNRHGSGGGSSSSSSTGSGSGGSSPSISNSEYSSLGNGSPPKRSRVTYMKNNNEPITVVRANGDNRLRFAERLHYNLNPKNDKRLTKPHKDADGGWRWHEVKRNKPMSVSGVVKRVGRGASSSVSKFSPRAGFRRKTRSSNQSKARSNAKTKTKAKTKTNDPSAFASTKSEPSGSSPDTLSGSLLQFKRKFSGGGDTTAPTKKGRHAGDSERQPLIDQPSSSS